MNEKDKQNMYRLFREHDDAVGSSKTTAIALEALSLSIQELKCAPSELKPLIIELCEVMKASEPRIVPLIRIILEFEREMEEHFGKSSEEIKEIAEQILMSKIERYNSNVYMVTQNGLSHIQDNDTIMVHTASTGVTNMFVKAKTEFGKQFRLLILKQDIAKTTQLLSALSKAEIDFTVVPEYDLSHIITSANKMFMGGLAITSDGKIVTATGTANVVSLCHLNGVPIYLFINTLKFSNHPAPSQRIHKKEEAISGGDFTYNLTTFSHDLVDFDLVSHMITECGEMNQAFYSKFFD